MRFKYRNIVSLFLLVLIFFSTIGFNIISTICDGCDDEHTSIVIVNIEDNISCECCSSFEETSCCHSEEDHSKEHHQSTSTFAKLNFDSPEAKSSTFNVNAPVFLIHFVSVLYNFDFTTQKIFFSPINDIIHSLDGRQILSLICILRN